MANNKPKIDLSQGISAGIMVWLGFLLCFAFLDYPVPLSIILGGFGAMATAWLSASWQSGDEEIYDLPEEPGNSLVKYSRQKTRLKEACKKRELEPIKTSKKTWKLTEYLFGKK